MERERKNAPEQPAARRRQRGSSVTEGIRRRIHAEPDVELSAEELRALADEGIEPDDLRRAAATPDDQEASPHDRDTPRDQLESLVNEDDY
jgi:hypothetical protein